MWDFFGVKALRNGFIRAALLAAIVSISFLPVAIFSQTASVATSSGEKHPALKDAVILIIRHAEKPAEGMTLSPAGEKRAEAYVEYFKKLTLEGKPVKLDHLFATADSKSSERPRLTVEPLGKAIGLKPDVRFKNKNVADLARELQSKSHGEHILICWHHGEIPSLVEALGENPAALLPGGKWPTEEFSWVLLLRFDGEGRLLADQCRCVHEKLMPGDD